MKVNHKNIASFFLKNMVNSLDDQTHENDQTRIITSKKNIEINFGRFIRQK